MKTTKILKRPLEGCHSYRVYLAQKISPREASDRLLTHLRQLACALVSPTVC